MSSPDLSSLTFGILSGALALESPIWGIVLIAICIYAMIKGNFTAHSSPKLMPTLYGIIGYDESLAEEASGVWRRPIDAESGIDLKDKTEAIAAFSSTGLHVLAVDDEPVNLQALKKHLTLHGHNVSVCSSGLEALKFIDERGKPDLILLDVMMPQMTGLQVCQKLRDRYSPTELPIILLTVKKKAEDFLSGFSVGANDYLTKPFSNHEVIARVHVHAQISAYEAALAHANEELRIQIAKRSEQLFNTLAMVGRGTSVIQFLKPGTIIGNRYKIIDLIAEGGMGIVYKAKTLSNGQRVALKIAKSGDPKALAQLAKEARMATEVIHDNVVRILDVDIANQGFLYIVMEYLEGKNLACVTQQWGETEWGIEILRQVCTGLKELHAHGLVHRDLKPANIMITDDEVDFMAKITDFGISNWVAEKRLEKQKMGLIDTETLFPMSVDTSGEDISDTIVEREITKITTDNTSELSVKNGDSVPLTTRFEHWLNHDRAGTPRFMAPEQLALFAPAGPSTDMWALGVIAYRILAKSWPFSEHALSDLITGIDTPKITSIRELAPKLDGHIANAVDACLSIYPEQRPTAEELLGILSVGRAPRASSPPLPIRFSA